MRTSEGQQRIHRFLRKYRVPVLIAVGLASIALTQTTWFADFIPLQKLEWALTDIRFRWRANRPGAPEIAIVGINSSTLDRSNVGDEERAQSEALRLMGEGPFPWNRKVFALLIEKLFAAGARVVALDFIFQSPNDGDPDLAAVLNKYAGRVVIASGMQKESEDTVRRRLTELLPNPALLSEVSENIVGLAQLHSDLDGVIRRVSYQTSVMREDGYEGYEDDLCGLAALAVQKFTGKPAPALHRQLINFQGPAATYPHLPLESVFIDAHFAKSRHFEFGKVFQDKLVFVGPIAEIFHDVHIVPYGKDYPMPGVEIHAQVAGDLLQNTLLSETSPWVGLALTIGLAGLAAFLCSAVRHALGQSGSLIGFGAGYYFVAQWLFNDSRLVLPMVPPLFAFATTGIFGVVFDFLIEQWERVRVRATLNRYVSKNVAELVLSDAASFEETLRGKKKRVTTLFSDIRGFTSLTETADANDLVAQLNEYFLKMVDSVLREDGTLQKFIGDAIMAVWGDTHSLGPEEDAARAVRAALRMRECLVHLNLAWKDNPARTPLQIGIGVDHGEVIVGNIGHPLRMEFTAVGDGINTAARLESATSQVGCDILIGEHVEELTRDKFAYRRIDLLRFKGKRKPMEAFTVLGDATMPAPEWLPEYHRAIGLYRAKNFTGAAELFCTVNAGLGGNDLLCKMYVARCTGFTQSPPGPEWDGAHTLTEK